MVNVDVVGRRRIFFHPLINLTSFMNTSNDVVDNANREKESLRKTQNVENRF